MTNLPATLSTLEREITALTDDLAPASAETIAACIDAMKRAGMTIPVGIPSNEIVTEYGIALRSVPKIGLKDAMRRIRQGEYTDMDYSFMPRPAELAKRSRAEAARYREDLTRKRETVKALRADPIVHDEGSRARVRKMLQDFHASRQADKAGTPDLIEPMDEERAEYWKSIMALKDADNVTEEQKQFRRRVEKRVADTEATAEQNNRSAA